MDHSWGRGGREGGREGGRGEIPNNLEARTLSFRPRALPPFLPYLLLRVKLAEIAQIRPPPAGARASKHINVAVIWPNATAMRRAALHDGAAVLHMSPLVGVQVQDVDV